MLSGASMRLFQSSMMECSSNHSSRLLAFLFGKKKTTPSEMFVKVVNTLLVIHALKIEGGKIYKGK